MVVTNAYYSTSTPFNCNPADGNCNSAGLNGPDQAFLAGDAFTMTFSQPVNALGLFIITSDLLSAGDLKLSLSMGSSVFNVASPQTTLSDGGQVYFLGLTSPSASFTSATIASGLSASEESCNECFLWNADNITTATVHASVPEPSASVLLGLSLGALGLVVLWKRSSRMAA
jgi:PEP-CTERM motif